VVWGEVIIEKEDRLCRNVIAILSTWICNLEGNGVGGVGVTGSPPLRSLFCCFLREDFPFYLLGTLTAHHVLLVTTTVLYLIFIEYIVWKLATVGFLGSCVLSVSACWSGSSLRAACVYFV
jgi:hypothetical protein